MKTLRSLILALCAGLLLAGLAAAWRPANAAPLFQLTPFPTPTPLPDGRIIYRVQPNDTLIRISLITGVSLDELRGLNNITGDNIFVGQELLLGLGGPSQVSPTPGPSPTPLPATPTPTPQAGFANLCVILYNDVDGNAMRELDLEPSIPGGAISVSDRSGAVSITEDTISGADPQCFEDLPEGDYTISVAAPEGYNPTTITNYSIRLRPGDETFIDFGAQANKVTIAEEAPAAQGGESPSPLLGILGGVFLLAGVGLALFAARILRRPA